MSRESWVRGLIVAGIGLCAGTIAGGVAGWYSAHVSVEPQILGLERIFRDQINLLRPAPATTTVEIVPVTPPSPKPVYPEFFLTRNTSPVLTLVRRSGVAKNESGVVTSDRVVGSVVSLTSDGWVTTQGNLFSSLRLADVSLAWRGRTYPLTQGYRDLTTGAVFLKADITGLPVTSLVRASDVLPGTVVWVEALTGQIRPSMITTVSVRATSTAVLPSELATRQFLLDSPVPEGNGGAVWSTRGELIGIVSRDRATDLARVLPANNLIQAFQSLLNDRQIRHATLGVRTVDLSQTVFEDSRAPALVGAWVTTLQPAVPAILPQSPASKWLQEGDVILRIERDLLDGRADLGERLLDYRPGSAVTIYGTRKGMPFQAVITLGTAITGEVLK